MLFNYLTVSLLASSTYARLLQDSVHDFEFARLH